MDRAWNLNRGSNILNEEKDAYKCNNEIKEWEKTSGLLHEDAVQKLKKAIEELESKINKQPVSVYLFYSLAQARKKQ